MIGYDAIPARRLDARIRKFRGTTLVAGPREVLELSETAAFIWERIDGTRTIRELGDAVAAHYDVPPPSAADDVASLIAELAANEIVDIRTE